LRQAVAQIPLEKILIETDCPFLAPQTLRGKRNEPSYVGEVAAKIAEIKELSLEEVAIATTRNARRLFALA
jgi:TatD DNase family protein